MNHESLTRLSSFTLFIAVNEPLANSYEAVAKGYQPVFIGY